MAIEERFPMSNPCRYTITQTLPNPQASQCISFAKTMCYPRPYIFINTCPSAPIVRQFQSGNICYKIKQCTGCTYGCAPFCGSPMMPC